MGDVMQSSGMLDLALGAAAMIKYLFSSPGR
jgi:hypothetical protein